MSFEDDLIATQPYLMRFALKLTNNHDGALDLVQDTFLRCLDKQHQFKPGTNLRAWAAMILRNTHFSNYRRGHRLVGDADGQLTEAMMAPPTQHGFMDMLDFMDAFALLPDDHQTAIYLVTIMGHTLDEAAEITGKPVGTIKSRVFRARASLRASLGVSGSAEYGPDAFITGAAASLDQFINNPHFQVH